jgi:nucleoside-diphosphate-sugar epimerase
MVGARLLPRLVEAGVACRALVRSGKTLPAGVESVEGDILDPASLTAAVRGVSVIIHLAAVLRTPDSDQIWKVNRDGTGNLIAAVKAHAPDARVIMASTGLVYDADSPRPACEHDACDPAMPYPASKLAAEKLLMASGLNGSIQRFGFVYGDADEHIAMLPKLAEMFKWHPANKLSMIHHHDIATAMYLALSGAMDGRIVNIVDEAPTTIYELTQIAGDAVEPSGAPLSNPWFGHLDSNLARALVSSRSCKLSTKRPKRAYCNRSPNATPSQLQGSRTALI